MYLSQNIVDLIPQGAPFIMVDELLFSDELSAKTGFLVRADNIFVEDNFFMEPGLVENIAQTAAARVGYDSMIAKTPVPVGYIGAVNDLQIFDLPKVGDRIETNIVIENQIFNVTLISGEVKCNDSIMATCKMKIFLSNS